MSPVRKSGEFCFVSREKWEDSDANLFDANDELIDIQPDWTMAHIAIHTGKFPSLSQAKKNGWNGPIPFGWTERKIGGNVKIFIWNPQYTLAEFEELEKLEK